MIIYEYKSDETIIKFDDKYLNKDKKDKEILDFLIIESIKKLC